MNYHVVVDPCGCCGRGERYHLCKSFRMFRGYRFSDGPWGSTITEWKEWKDALLSHSGYVVVDEDGDIFPVSVVIDRVESGMTRDEREAYWREHSYALHKAGYQTDLARGVGKNWWRDGDGYAFHGDHFS